MPRAALPAAVTNDFRLTLTNCPGRDRAYAGLSIQVTVRGWSKAYSFVRRRKKETFNGRDDWGRI